MERFWMLSLVVRCPIGYGRKEKGEHGGTGSGSLTIRLWGKTDQTGDWKA